MHADVSDPPDLVHRMLRNARRCAIAPAVAGCTSLAGWLCSGGVMAEVGIFYVGGMVAILFGLLLFPPALYWLYVAVRRGAARRRVLAVAVMLCGNVPLAGMCWLTASSLLQLQIIRVVNNSAEPAGPIEIRLQPAQDSNHRLSIPRLLPGRAVVRAWLYGGEGVAEFRAVHGGRKHSSSTDDSVFLGIGQPMEVRLTLGHGGVCQFEGIHNPRWAWLVALLRGIW